MPGFGSWGTPDGAGGTPPTGLPDLPYRRRPSRLEQLSDQVREYSPSSAGSTTAYLDFADLITDRVDAAFYTGIAGRAAICLRVSAEMAPNSEALAVVARHGANLHVMAWTDSYPVLRAVLVLPAPVSAICEALLDLTEGDVQEFVTDVMSSGSVELHVGAVTVAGLVSVRCNAQDLVRKLRPVVQTLCREDFPDDPVRRRAAYDGANRFYPTVSSGLSDETVSVLTPVEKASSVATVEVDFGSAPASPKPSTPPSPPVLPTPPTTPGAVGRTPWTDRHLQEAADHAAAGRKKAALSSLFTVQAVHPDDEAVTRLLASLVYGETGRGELTASDMLDPRLDAVFCSCDAPGCTASWISAGQVSGDQVVVTNPRAGRCLAGHGMFCRRHFGSDHSCPVCGGTLDHAPTTPNGRTRTQTERLNQQLVHVFVLWEGTGTLSGETMTELFRAMSPDVFEDNPSVSGERVASLTDPTGELLTIALREGFLRTHDLKTYDGRDGSGARWALLKVFDKRPKHVDPDADGPGPDPRPPESGSSSEPTPVPAPAPAPARVPTPDKTETAPARPRRRWWRRG